MTTLLIIGLFVLGWLILAVLTWALCVSASRGDAAFTDRTGRADGADASGALGRRQLPAA